MSIDVVDLRNFYGQRLGVVARRFVGRGIRSLWRDAAGQRVLGIGYTTPYLPICTRASVPSASPRPLPGERLPQSTACRRGPSVYAGFRRLRNAISKGRDLNRRVLSWSRLGRTPVAIDERNVVGWTPRSLLP